ncbi:SRPBCC domain-containing protein [Streptomyces sp. MBT56]|uniref:SRPBCC family protein n=1 Tax=unclassified Streptomyces TaxID=2593676 RepID=UPI00190AD279|nr:MULTISPECIES: SRPBCC domain-containing protein [unclassified Streptomyces]MBK3557887.1 SRPBCC domain-containing protein [Streptomyces sp. MBT56]MBK3604598.1 SRPBCC domain-containing protein [Streptomyces sp. MBT54]MBK3615168.1 SRPBCC domain-containing protein [Streptomyces sp. MBT98]MBK6042613.1 SRPBCC domain-containing protein [Streptomyces sp. MBT55]
MTGGTREGIDLTRVLDAPQQRVFAAWTSPEDFAAWYGGEADVPLDRVAMDVRPGGSWRLVIVMPGVEMPFHGVYREVSEPDGLVFTLKDGSALEDAEGEMVTVTFSDLGGGRTELAFQQRGGNLTPEQYAAAEDGWEAFFDALADRLATHP